MPDGTPRDTTEPSRLFADLGKFQGVVGADAKRDFDLNRDHLLEVMGPEGDTKTIWDPDKQDEVDNARQTFENLVDKGYRAYHVVGKDGAQGDKMDEFDPVAGRMILIPPMQGG